MKSMVLELFAAVVMLTVVGCGDESSSNPDASTDADSDSDTETDSDTDTDDCVPEDTFNPADCPSIDSGDAKVRYVNATAEEPGDGTSWATAFESVQAGIDACRCVALALDGQCQVWVTQGTYLTDWSDRCDTFWLRSEVDVYGGFTGAETSVEARDWEANVTTADGGGVAYHVVTGANAATIDGFTISGGNADGMEMEQQGGGMLNHGVSPTVVNCVFRDNWASLGGGMSNYDASSPTVTNCTFSDNTAHSGGGMFNDLDSSPIVSSCRFSGNSAILEPESEAGGDGGGMRNNQSSPILTNCIFTDNSAQFYGGGIENVESNPALTNCSFAGNSSSEEGGAVDNLDSSPTLTNCILWGDSSESGPEIYNCPSQQALETTVTYSDVEGSCTVAAGCTADETGNIGANPLFVDAAAGDLHLQPGSPCIDAADTTVAPEFDLEGNSRVGDADMGAYEFTGAK